jgi:transcriptional regulator with XRE-family HTH domain
MDMTTFYEFSTPELVRLLGTRFREYRLRCGLTQSEVAQRSGVGMTTIHKFENGTAGNLSLSTFLLLLKVVGRIEALDALMPELPESPYLQRPNEKTSRRVRHSRKQSEE